MRLLTSAETRRVCGGDGGQGMLGGGTRSGEGDGVGMFGGGTQSSSQDDGGGFFGGGTERDGGGAMGNGH